jgi:transposase
LELQVGGCSTGRTHWSSYPLWFDGSGWCLYDKRLERGTFELPEVPDGARQVRVEPSIPYLLLEGIDLRADPRRWYRRSSD